MPSITEEDLNSMITRRRSLSGETYEKARKNVLDYLKGSGRITEEEYERLKNTRGH
jgi:membrane peptidoglycan carboxypeptidase